MFTYTKDVAYIVAYMIGIKKETLEMHYDKALLEELYKNKEATIIRYLCKLRTTLWHKYKLTDNEMRYNLKNLNTLEWFDYENINRLENWGIPIIRANYTAEKYLIDITTLINHHVDACKDLFGDWVNFEYIKDLFVIPKHTKKQNMIKEFEKFMSKMDYYPFQMYIHWNPGDYGNILINDAKFLDVLYLLHGDHFYDKSKVIDATNKTKKSIYDFIEKSQKIVIAVDCENSDVFKLYGVLKGLHADKFSKIQKILLYDDSNTPEGWEWLTRFTKIPVEYTEVERIVERKSLVDMKVTTGVCAAYYKDNIDSFILCSSDSDFWGLISSLPDARFLVMYENENCSSALKKAMTEHGIANCSMDEFYTGNATDLKKSILLDKLKSYSQYIIGINGKELAKRIYDETGIKATESDIEQFYNKYIKSMRLKTNQNGIFYIDNDELYMEPEKIDANVHLISESQIHAFIQKIHCLGGNDALECSAKVTDEIISEILRYVEEFFDIPFKNHSEKS